MRSEEESNKLYEGKEKRRDEENKCNPMKKAFVRGWLLAYIKRGADRKKRGRQSEEREKSCSTHREELALEAVKKAKLSWEGDQKVE